MNEIMFSNTCSIFFPFFPNLHESRDLVSSLKAIERCLEGKNKMLCVKRQEKRGQIQRQRYSCDFREHTLGNSACIYADMHLKAVPGNQCDAQKVTIATAMTAWRKKKCLFTQFDLWIRSHSSSNELFCLCEWLRVN